MNKKIIKIAKIFIILSIIVSLLIYSFIANDCHHLTKCHEQHCRYCALILIAQTVVITMLTICVYMIIGYLIFFTLSIIYKNKIIILSKSLLFQAVQFNE